MGNRSSFCRNSCCSGLPGCENSCANISIPYPFGTREGCYIEARFLVTCHHTIEPPKLYLDKSTIEVTEIFLFGQLRILSWIGYYCYEAQGDKFDAWIISGKFHLSNTRNKFTAAGCDTYAVIKGSHGKIYTTGCLSYCESIDNVINGSCSGIGCCQTTIPEGVRNFNISLQSYNYHQDVWAFNPCSYAFVVEDAAYNFSSADLLYSKRNTESPVILDWAIWDQTCDAARKNLTSYACKENSHCYEVNNRLGYRCNCSEGYEGNPYLPNGCLGISISISVVLLGGSWLYWVFRQRKIIKLEEKFFHQNGEVMLQRQLSKRNVNRVLEYHSMEHQHFSQTSPIPQCPQGKRLARRKEATMASLGMLVHVMLVVVVLPSAAIAAPPTAADLKRLGCADSCGNLSIPYPFGVKKNCYLGDEFLISCSSSKPYYGKIPLKSISLEGELRIMQLIARDCYDLSGAPIASNNTKRLRLTKFPISNTKNKFTAIGCDTYATAKVSDYKNSATTGCVSQCSDVDYIPDNGTCSGIGCCQTSIPKGVGYLYVVVKSFSNHRNISHFNPCSYAFAVEETAFNFSKSYLHDFKEKKMPLVLDWAIGNKTCEGAKSNQTSYACGQNSDCHGLQSGYICKCSIGYLGNPYLLDGCQDINECEDQNLNMCLHKKKCFNTPGSFKCSCPKGHHGDGRTDGKGCIADRFLVIQILVGFSIGVTVVLVSSSWLYWIFKKRKLIKLKEKFFRQNGGLMLQQKLSRTERSTQEVITIFTSEELKAATNNYDESRIVGRGGNGTVYKGILTDNRTVAIKKSRMVDETQIEQFINEVVVLSQINHRNVVKLLGCCLETQVPLLVYEFITNGTLFDHIHNEMRVSAFSWVTRLKIATETAGVLSYLHSAASVPIIHRDVKSTNILLDENCTAKVSDFGASRLVPIDQNELATVVQGTLGYLDPEYLQTSQLTEKSDVYSFGVVLAELITGKKALLFDRPEEERCLAIYFLSYLKNDRLYQVIDPRIVIEGNIKQFTELADLAKRCLNVRGEERPTMKEVAIELEGFMNKIEKHPRIKSDMNSEEIGYLHDETSSAFGFGGSSNTTTEYDTTRLLPLELEGGR